MSRSDGPRLDAAERLFSRGAGFASLGGSIGVPANARSALRFPVTDAPRVPTSSSHIAEMQATIDFLGDKVRRLSLELSQVQGASLTGTGDGGVILGDLENDSMPPWQLNAKYMSPLLVAYDNKIKDAANEIKRLKEEGAQMEKEVKHLVLDNQELTNKLKSEYQNIFQHINRGMTSCTFFSLGLKPVQLAMCCTFEI